LRLGGALTGVKKLEIEKGGLTIMEKIKIVIDGSESLRAAIERNIKRREKWKAACRRCFSPDCKLCKYRRRI